jgi:threonine dehydratase
VGERREAILAVTVPEERGSFRRFCELLGPRNVTEFNYRIADAKVAHLFVGLQIHDRTDVATLISTLQRHDFQTLDLTDDEMAKLHIRHLVGGHSALARNERLFRFEFPERPGALMKFLTSMSPSWNISLCHYRNHGADYGRILVGMQVPPEDQVKFQEFLDKLGYEYAEESKNPAYKLFLG